MALLTILHHPDQKLRQKSAPVLDFSNLSQLVLDMAETMYVADGIGLAAPQVGLAMRLFIIDLEEGRGLKVFVNPEITEQHGVAMQKEGCLSFPGIVKSKTRATSVFVHAQDEKGIPFGLFAEGLLAQAIQHENDHLNGVLLID